ncbi:MAG: matrixin family metalloprotease [Dehalococcoidia bacterium]|nr:matrixin family metalloprotease [Dehalococcoidia bacterium]
MDWSVEPGIRALALRAKPQRGASGGVRIRPGAPAPPPAFSAHSSPSHGVGRVPGARAVTRGFLYGLFFWALILFTVAVLPGLASRSLGPRWEQPVVAFSAEPDLQPYVEAGATLWRGASALQLVGGGADVFVRSGPLAPPVHYAGQPAQANLSFVGSAIAHCEVRVEPVAFAQLSEAGRQNVVAHELGHCLGLDHSDQPSIMKNPLLYGFSADDVAGLAALYGPPIVAASPPLPSPTPVPLVAGVEAMAPGEAASANARTGAVQLAPVAAPSSEAAAPAPALAEPQSAAPYAGPLAPGWNRVVWAGPSAPAERCGCAAVYRDATESWSAGDVGFGGPNTAGQLEPGVVYWMWTP